MDKWISKCDNPFQKDFFRKIFNDNYYYNGGIKPKYHGDNFAYTRLTEKDNKSSNIIERMLIFLAQYPSFHERTGLGFWDLMAMDPSTSIYMQDIWAELTKPEEAQANKMSKLLQTLMNKSQQNNQ